MWLVLQPILMVGMLLTDDVLATFVMAVLARPRDRCTKAIGHNADDCVRSTGAISNAIVKSCLAAAGFLTGLKSE